MFLSRSTFRIRVVTLFFRKETVFLVLVMKQKEATQLSVGSSLITFGDHAGLSWIFRGS
jgi:hypothetical protein